MAKKGIKGRLIIITGASGVGKTVIANKFLELEKNFKRIVTETTRPPRPGEVHGIDYLFRSHDEFHQLHQSGYYAEINEYRPNEFKGTARHHFDKLLSGESFVWLTDQVRATNFHQYLSLEQDVLTEIKSRTTTVLIGVSKQEVIWERYQSREPNADKKTFDERFKRDLEELEILKPLFDHTIFNDSTIEDSVSQLQSIIQKIKVKQSDR